MADIWEEAAEEARASADSSVYELATFEILHAAFVDEDDFPDSIRGVLDGRDWDLELEAGAPLKGGQVVTFTSMGFRLVGPEQEPHTLGGVRLAFDNVPLPAMDWLDEAAAIRGDARLIVRLWHAERNMETGAYSASGPPLEVLGGLIIRDIHGSGTSIEASARWRDLENRGLLHRRFTQEQFPGLFA